MQSPSNLPSVDKDRMEEYIVPVNSLFVLDGELVGKSVSVSKEDGCNTKVVSEEFADQNGHLILLKER